MAKPQPQKEISLEVHAATSREQCLEMERRLRSQGLDLTLVGSDLTGDALLSALCLFSGSDADPEADRWTTYGDD